MELGLTRGREGGRGAQPIQFLDSSQSPGGVEECQRVLHDAAAWSTAQRFKADDLAVRQMDQWLEEGLYLTSIEHAGHGCRRLGAPSLFVIHHFRETMNASRASPCHTRL